MDKYEYKVRADEIKALIAEGEYAEAAKIADTIDWRRVKSVMMLCTISDLYKINRRYEDSRDILLLAYEKHSGGRLIVYSLCELSIKLEEYVQAIEYYKEFVQLAPKDSGRYILQYKLYEAQEVSLEERIAVLEELKKKDYREKWAYELAYLYHRVGLETKCVEECDEMFLWFGEGRYVLKALELKMLHQSLSEEQQLRYEQMKNGVSVPEIVSEGQAIQQEAENASVEEEDNEFDRSVNILTDPTQEMPSKEELDDIQVKTVDVSQYNTINLQKELAESMKEFLENNKTMDIPVEQVTDAMEETKIYEPVTETVEEAAEPVVESVESAEEFVQEVMPEMQPEETSVSEEVFFGNTSEVSIEDVVSELAEKNMEGPKTTVYQNVPMEEPVKAPDQMKEVSVAVASPNPAISNTGIIRTFHKPSGYDSILSQEYDGQISLVVPEQEKIEKQITGQLSIDDIMSEWEKVKKENERKRMEDIKERVHKQTNALFADFDESTKTGLLEELEKAMLSAAMMEEKKRIEEGRPRVIKVSDIEKTEEEPEAVAEMAVEPAEETTAEDVAEEIVDTEVTLEEAQALEEVALADEAEDEEAFEELELIEEEYPEEDTETEDESEQEDVFEETDEESIGDTAEWEALEAESEEEQLAEEEISEDIVEDVIEDESEEDSTASEEDEEDEAEEGDEREIHSTPDAGQKYQAREMNQTERELFAPFIHHKKTRRQIVEAIDNISMASYTGNVILTGEEGTGTIALAKLLVKEIQMSDNNFSGKVAKISGTTLNKKDVATTLSKLEGGALIIEGASAMEKNVVDTMLKEMNQEDKGLIVMMEDNKQAMNNFLEKNPSLLSLFNLRVDVEAMDDQTLVKYAKKYALEQEYSIDELGVLALHTRIADMQTSDHEVTLAEIEELVDEAIYYADKKTPKHFFDVLFGKRYDEEDMIILREKDFMHY